MFEFESQREPLRRCPFCGAPAKYVATASTERGAIRGWVFCIKCQECGASIPKKYKFELQINSDGGLLVGVDERDEAKKDWNVRADDIDLIKQKGTFYENQKNYKSVQGK